MPNRISPQRAAGIALQAVPGEIIEMELEVENGRLVYEIDILTSFGVYEVEVDAYTAEILEIERD